MQPSPTANPLPPVSKSSAETSENEAAVEEVPSGSGAVLYHDTQSALYHDTQSTPANDGDLFDEHDKITRFLFQVMGASFTPPPPDSTLFLFQPHSVTIIFVFLALLFYSAFGSMERSSSANALLGIKASAICFLL